MHEFASRQYTYVPMFLRGVPMYEHPRNTHVIAFAMKIVAFTLNQLISMQTLQIPSLLQ